MASEWLPGWVAQRLELQGVVAGAWNFQVDAGSSRSVDPGWLFASSGAQLFAGAWVDTQQLVAGDPIAVVAQVQGRELLMSESARLSLETETEVRELAMHDDGAHGDGQAGDGRFGAFVPTDLLGQVRARIDLFGTARNGGKFARSALLSFPVLAPQLRLDGTGQARLLDGARLEIALGALPQNSVSRLHVSAEVWGRDAAGRAAPVCWLSKMLLPEVAADRWLLPLSLDLDWLDVEGLRAPLELRAVRVQDPDTQVVFDRLDRIEFATPALDRPRTTGGSITSKMLTGNSDTTIGSSGAAPPEYPHYRSLVLVHGYCSSGSIWPAADFSQPKLEFLDPNANRSHDQFAQLIAQRAAAQHLGSFGVVAHSQGGPAALHLLTYYNSALDRSSAGRRIQSVASPYQGTPLASLGGFACGVNSDMTPTGSATWLAGIPSWARAEVSTWTTANSGSACNALTSLFLTDPEDGTVEKFRSELPGGNNLGHVVGWCHTTGMSNPANYTDHARNLSMDAAAGR
jgi:pimeloyl-ACP methyl ester carboxylesterase